MCADNARSVNAAFLIRDGFNEAIGPPLGLGTIVLRERPPQDSDIIAQRFLCLHFGQTHIGKLRIGEGHPRHGTMIGLGRQFKHGIANDDTGVIAGDMCELQTA